MLQAERIDAALAAMAARAQELGVTGVAVVLESVEGADRLSPHFLIVGRAERKPNRGPEDAGTNYLAVSFSKVAEMFVTGADSGHAGREPRTGEFGYRGGVISPGETWLYPSFSGGTQDEDVEIARAGMASLLGSAD